MGGLLLGQVGEPVRTDGRCRPVDDPPDQRSRNRCRVLDVAGQIAALASEFHPLGHGARRPGFGLRRFVEGFRHVRRFEQFFDEPSEHPVHEGRGYRGLMPELPEVETIRRQLAPQLIGRTFVAGDAHESAKFAPALDAVGATVTDVRRRGKYLIFDLDDGAEELIGHLGMTGSFFRTAAEGDHPACSAHDAWVRAVWRMDDGNDLVFRDVRRFGRLRVVTAGDYEDIPTLRDMGLEPFDPAFNGKVLHERLRGSRRAVKTQLLSQRPVAGVGNIYADEALFLAGIHPLARRVGRARADRLAETIVAVLQAGVENGGTTLRDYVDAEGDTGRNQHELVAYGRGGEPCVECGTALRTRTIDARTSTFCTHCQRV